MSQVTDDLDELFGVTDNTPDGDEFDALFASPPVDQDPINRVINYINGNKHHWVRMNHPVGHHVYPRGLWALKEMQTPEIIGDLIRYFDYDQLLELAITHEKGFTNEYQQLFYGEGETEGPVRIGKPPIDPFGKLTVLVNNGNHGSLKRECEWIEKHSQVFIQYAGEDENWPRGCWVMEHEGGQEHYDDDQIRYIAHEHLGMPFDDGYSSSTRSNVQWYQTLGPVKDDFVYEVEKEAWDELVRRDDDLDTLFTIPQTEPTDNSDGLGIIDEGNLDVLDLMFLESPGPDTELLHDPQAELWALNYPGETAAESDDLDILFT